jgi:hypothetical protein
VIAPLPEHTVVVPETFVGAVGVVILVTGKTKVEPVQLPEEGVQVILPLPVKEAVPVILLIVDEPLQPEGSVQLYVVAPVTPGHENKLPAPTQTVEGPVIPVPPEGCGLMVIVSESWLLLPQLFIAKTEIVVDATFPISNEMEVVPCPLKIVPPPAGIIQ